MCSPVEKPAGGEPQMPFSRAERVQDLHLPPGRRKETLLPVIIQLALEGESGRAIADKLGLPERTVNHWLARCGGSGSPRRRRAPRRCWPSAWRNSMRSIARRCRAWRDSPRETQVETRRKKRGRRRTRKETLGPRPTPTPPQRRHARQGHRCREGHLPPQGQHAKLRNEGDRLDAARMPLESLTADDLNRSDGELRVIEARISAAIAAEGGESRTN